MTVAGYAQTLKSKLFTAAAIGPLCIRLIQIWLNSLLLRPWSTLGTVDLPISVHL